MNGRQCAPRHDQAAIRYACKCRYVSFDVTGVAHVDRSYLDPKRRRHGLDGAELANPNGGSRMTATRFTAGTICLSSSSHFPLMPNSNVMNPVAFPPGR